MMSIPVVYVYVIISCLVNTNAIAGSASVPTEYESSSLIVLNACSQDPPCFISYFVRVEYFPFLLPSPSILHLAEKNYFYFPVTSTSKVSILKHIDEQDPGTIIITKKLRDENNCFVVSGNYSTAKVSNCLNASSVTAVHGTDRNLLVYNNSTKDEYIAVMQLRYGVDVIFTRMIYPKQTKKENFFDNAAAANLNVSGPPIVSFFKKQWETSKAFPIEENIQLGSLDTCIYMNGNFEDAQVVYTPCETPRGRRPSTTTATGTTTTERPGPLYYYELPDARK